MLRGIGSAYLKKIIQIPNFINLTVEDLAKYSPEIEKALSDKKVWENCQGQVDFQLIQAEKNKARIISLLDPEYPKLLAETKDAPVILYVKGQLSKHSEKSVAIVGTRKPTSQGSEIANRITRFFVENGWSIVSGLAIGCDTRAHKTALSLGGHTVAVLAHGLDMVYPKENIPLAEEILASGGALISEYCFNQEVKNHQYVKRDQVQAGMAQGVVMIQSSLTGGSLHAPRASLSYNRWLAVPIPTKKDMQNLEDSIKANIVITDEDQSEKIKLLKCTQKQLEHIIVLKSKNDYYRMTEFSLKTKSELSNLSLNLADKQPLEFKHDVAISTLESSNRIKKIVSIEDDPIQTQTYLHNQIEYRVIVNINTVLNMEDMDYSPNLNNEVLNVELLAVLSLRFERFKKLFSKLKRLCLNSTNSTKNLYIQLAFEDLLQEIKQIFSIFIQDHKISSIFNYYNPNKHKDISIDFLDLLNALITKSPKSIVLEYTNTNVFGSKIKKGGVLNIIDISFESLFFFFKQSSQDNY